MGEERAMQPAMQCTEAAFARQLVGDLEEHGVMADYVPLSEIPEPSPDWLDRDEGGYVLRIRADQITEGMHHLEGRV